MFGNRFVFIQAFLCAMIAAMVFACGENAAPVPQNNAVRTKIAGSQQQPPQTAIATEQIPAVEKKDTGGAQPPEEQKNERTSDLIQASLAIASTYDATGRFDPFEPLFKEEPDIAVEDTSKQKRKKRVPQTPLERVALGQLKLSAIIRAPSGNRALVEDATGKGYVVENGTYMGLNSGRVIKIERDRVVVEEEVENVLGELTLKNTELKLQKPAGEL
jgi:type IV pilus assembly protein PilP